MHKIVKIIEVVRLLDKEGKPYCRTYALLDNQDEVCGWSRLPDEFKVGDEVESFHHDDWDMSKMKKKG